MVFRRQHPNRLNPLLSVKILSSSNPLAYIFLTTLMINHKVVIGHQSDPSKPLYLDFGSKTVRLLHKNIGTFPKKKHVSGPVVLDLLAFMDDRCSAAPRCPSTLCPPVLFTLQSLDISCKLPQSEVIPLGIPRGAHR